MNFTDVNTVLSPYKLFKNEQPLTIIKHFGCQKFEVQVLMDNDNGFYLEYNRIGQPAVRSGPSTDFYLVSFSFDRTIQTLGGI